MKKNRAMALVIKNEKILMVYEYYEHYFWSLPGGGIEPGESPEQTAIRELKEETGIDGEILRPLNTQHHADGQIEYTFLVKMKDENQKAIPGYDPEEISAPEEERRGVKKTDGNSFEELSRVDQDYLISAGYLNK